MIEAKKNLLLLVCVWLSAVATTVTPQSTSTSTSGYTPQPRDTVIECGNTLNSIFYNNALNYGNGQTFVVYSNTAQSSSYRDLTRCEARFFTENSAVVFTVTLQTFHLEYNAVCGYDSLCIDGILYCGPRNESIQYQYIVPAYSSFTLRFYADGSVTPAGFTAVVGTRSAFYYDEVYEPTGVSAAPSQDSISQYQYVSLYTLSDYRDSCNTDPFYNTTTSSYDNYQTSSTYDDYYQTSTPYEYYYTTWYYDSNRLSENCRYVIQNAASYINSAIQTLSYGLSVLISNLNG